MQNRKTCTHIKISGIRCGSPSLRGEQFCYYHQRMHRGVRTPRQSRLHPLACIEDKESIQSALAEVINALLRNTIDMKRATLILRALHIAVKNDARVSVHADASSMVKEVPEYDEAAGSYDSRWPVRIGSPVRSQLRPGPARRQTSPQLQNSGRIRPTARRNHCELLWLPHSRSPRRRQESRRGKESWRGGRPLPPGPRQTPCSDSRPRPSRRTSSPGPQRSAVTHPIVSRPQKTGCHGAIERWSSI